MQKIFVMFFLLMFSACGQKDEPVLPVVEEGFVEVTGGRVWYRIIGKEQKGTPLLVLHGGPGVPHDYLEPLEALAGERPVIFYDQLGCGNSDRPGDTALYSVARYVEELTLVREALAPGNIHLLGQSWGTMLAVEYLLRNQPDGVKSLTLSAPYLSTALWEADQQDWIRQLPEATADTIRACEARSDFDSPAYQEALMVFYNKHVCRMNPWPHCMIRSMEKMGGDVYNYMWGPSEFTMNGSLKNADLTPDLPHLQLPVLFTCGELDEATPETTRFYSSLIPGSKMITFTMASHSHHLEKQALYLQTVRGFLAECE